jgi:Tol biopolymer transport system component/DNA-binding winged helix-turn-helix (wHTH) protein
MPPVLTHTSPILRFSVFEVNLQTGELRRKGHKIKLQDQPFRVLAALLERPGELVTREELRSKLWPADTFVDFDHSLNAAIKRLRDALRESTEAPAFIETMARRGYRFIGNVEVAAPVSSRPTPWHWLSARRTAVLGAIAACVLAPSFVYYIRSSNSKVRRTATAPEAISVVTNVGEKYTPSLSPDGQHLAFAWNGGSGPAFSIYVKLVGTEDLLRLTKRESSIDFNPVWSPDGRYIGFCRILEGETGIYIIPALGGAERRVRETLWQERKFDEILWSAGRLSWSPDGKLLAFSDGTSRSEASIFLLSLDSLEVRRLSSPLHSIGVSNLAFSPDGQTLAFTKVSQAFNAIYTVPVSGGEEQRLVSDGIFHWGLAWTPDGRNIVFQNGPVNAGWLWKVPFPGGGEPERLQFSHEGIEPAIRGNRLVYVLRTANLNIWRRNLNSLVAAGSPDRLISSTKMESGPQFSPDGTKIAFESNRSGAYEIWMCRSDGSGLVQLTHFNSSSSGVVPGGSDTHAGTPRWSPNGQQIAFDSFVGGNVDIFVVDAQGGSPHRLTSEPSIDVVPSWSRDGHWIYFSSNRSGSEQVWKMPSVGGPAVQITQHGGFAAFESPDGEFLYYAKGLTVPGLWRIPTQGGEEIEIISSLEAGYWGYWAVVEKGIYYLDLKKTPGINFFDIASHRVSRVFDLESRPARRFPGLAVSPDKKTILYTQLDALNNDVILVENFR